MKKKKMVRKLGWFSNKLKEFNEEWKRNDEKNSKKKAIEWEKKEQKNNFSMEKASVFIFYLNESLNL